MNRTLTVADSIGVAYRVCKRDLKYLTGILMTATIFYTAGKMGFLWCLHEYAVLRSQSAGLDDLSTFAMIFIAGLVSGIVSYAALFWLICKQLAYVRMIVFEREDYEKELAEVSKHKWKIFVYFIAAFVFVTMAMVLLIVFFAVIAVLMKMLSVPASIAGAVVLLMSILGVAIVFMAFIPVLLFVLIMGMEGGGFFRTIQRSFELSFKNMGKLLGFGILGYIVFVLVGFCLQAPYQIYYLFNYAVSVSNGPDNLAGSPLLTVPLYIQMLAAAWQSIIFMYLYPAFWLGAGYVYNTIRMKDDGIDIIRDIDRLSLKEV